MTMELDIVIIEDVPEDAEAIERELLAEALLFKVRRLQSREELSRALDTAKPDVILSDFTLPDFNAMEALELLRARGEDIPFILVTGTRSEEVAVECIRMGADDYILKASLKRLPSSIHNAIGKKAAERRRAEAESGLRRSEAHFRHIAEHSGDLISTLDVEGRFGYANPSFQTGLGHAPSDLAGTLLWQWIHADDRDAAQRRWAESRQTRGACTLEYRFRHRDGTWRVLESSVSPMASAPDAPHQSVVLSRDVTRRKAEEDALRQWPRLVRDAQEAERRRVSRELHDGVMQILSSVKFRFQSIEERLGEGMPALEQDAVKASALLERAIAEVRQIARNLRPGELDDLGLVPAVRSLAEDIAERTGLRMNLSLEELPRPLDPDLQLQLYRIVQEALANVERHAQAACATVRFQLAPGGGAFEVSVSDDGCGFDPPLTGQTSKRVKSGMGLVDIRERARLIGAECRIGRRRGGGTELSLTVPLPRPAPASPQAEGGPS